MSDSGPSREGKRELPLTVLRHRDYRLIWAGEAVSGVGTQMHAIALSWQVFEMTGSVALLGLLGLVRAISLMTHTHFDHAGNTADFSDTEIIIHKDAHAFGRDRWDASIPGGIPEFAQDGTRLEYRLIEGDLELAEGLTLLETPGHAPGHMSILAQLPASGAFLLAIDAIYSRFNHERENYQVAFDSDQAKSSGMRCIRLAEEHNAELIYGHDPAQWTSLRTAPSRYR